MTCAEDRFYRDVAHHEMRILTDEGVNRSVRFKDPKSFYGHFTIVTWPGHLCISGDMGCWVFARVHDMFRFFRMEEQDEKHARERGETLAVNPSYWAEKLEATDRGGGAYEFSPDAFRQRVADRYRQWSKDYRPPASVKRALRRELDLYVLYSAEDEHEAYRAAHEFAFDQDGYRFQLEDFGTCERFSFRYLWACYAIVWAIWHYDQRSDYADFWRNAA